MNPLFIFLVISVYCFNPEEAQNNCLPSQYLNDNGKCYDCASFCAKCESENRCVECYDNYFLDEESGQCFSCHFHCKSCTSYQNCSACKNTDPVNGICYFCGDLCKTCTLEGCIECLEEAYLKDGECIHCSEGCAECYNSDECIACYSNHRYINGKCVYIGACKDFNGISCLECELGYYLYDGRCLLCFPNCKYCNSYDECTECFDDSYLYNGKCFKCSENCKSCDDERCFSCDFGYYQEIEECKPCKEGCTSCISSEICESCADSYFFMNNKCEKCSDNNCKNCETDGNCIICESGYTLVNNICLKCPDNCDKCSEDLNCLQCNEHYIKNDEGYCVENYGCEDYENGKCYKCENNYYIQDGKCFKSDSNCNGQLSSPYCVGCLTNTTYLDDNFYCSECPYGSSYCVNGEEAIKCDLGFYKNNMGLCSPCPENCWYCLDEKNCISCNNDYYLKDSVCTCLYPDGCPHLKSHENRNLHANPYCNDGFYFINNECLACLEGCKMCKSITRCMHCFSNYTEISGLCYLSDESSGFLIQVLMVSLLGVLLS
ncbi:hypothetical protein SteCoe_293 [Stentor coeruleus]|uniref:TNFR-Cys domain-containing protein n=1 Tax=Stentor coeruleus TaxID=5963 RepID=A0A1R2D4H6_9CILI|nr:hypothetical protein SteCoe_293 [Stentor coeruleus]